jgi:hypothetical protein
MIVSLPFVPWTVARKDGLETGPAEARCEPDLVELVVAPENAGTATVARQNTWIVAAVANNRALGGREPMSRR